MNIIFDSKSMFDNKHIVLELDTFRFAIDGSERTAYCVIENMPLEEMPIVESLKETHSKLISEYRNQNWNSCEQLIEQLTGKWNGEMDTFYEVLSNRIADLKTLTLPDDWTPIIPRD